jgi:hypothetical protein
MISTTQRKSEQGMIRWFLLIIIALVLASYFFNFSVQDAVEDEQTQENASYIGQQATTLWENHLEEPVLYFWNDIFLELIWSAFTENMERLRDGENTVYEDNAPGVNINTTADITNDPIDVGFVNSEEEGE